MLLYNYKLIMTLLPGLDEDMSLLLAVLSLPPLYYSFKLVATGR